MTFTLNFMPRQPIRLSEASKIWDPKEHTIFPVLPMIYLILFTWSEASARGKNFQWQDWVAYSLLVLKCLEPNTRQFRGKLVAKPLMPNERQFRGKNADGKPEANYWGCRGRLKKCISVPKKCKWRHLTRIQQGIELTLMIPHSKGSAFTNWAKSGDWN